MENTKNLVMEVNNLVEGGNKIAKFPFIAKCFSR